jgi:hypothetical protein
MRTPLKEFVRDVLYRDTSRKNKWVFIDMRRLGERREKERRKSRKKERKTRKKRRKKINK